ncbi:CBS domain-containing protein [Bdellovibrionota bacterium FG-2]
METTAEEIMSTELTTLSEDATLEDALKTLSLKRITGVPVVDGEGKLLGICSEFDVLLHVRKHKTLNAGLFQEKIIFSREPQVIKRSTPLREILESFVERRFRRLPVVDEEGRLVGIITRRDLMRVYYYRAKLS